MREAGKLLKPPAHLRVCAITASRENNAVTRSDKLAGTQDDPGHPPVIDREPPHVLVSEDCHAAVENRPEELANQAQTLASHVLPIALLNESRIPVGSAVDATPGDLLLRRHKARDVVRHRDALTPIAEFEARDEISLDGPAKRVRARGPIVIMVGHTTDDTKTDAASFEEPHRLRRPVDESGQPIVIDIAATKKPHIGEDFISAIAAPGSLRQVVLAHPDEPIGMNRGAANRGRLFQDD